jgi:hypothetical protein
LTEDDYGISKSYVLLCEDGKKYSYEISGYGLDSLNPYYKYEEANREIIKQINKDMEK